MEDHIQLIQSLAQGNRKVFRQLYDSYVELVFNTALSYTKNYEDAQEVTQDVFSKVFLKATHFKGNSTVKTWIYRIVVNTSLNFIKKKKRLKVNSVEELDNKVPDFVHPGVLMENKEKATILYAAIGRLNTNQETAFILSYIEGLPRQEVADIMEMSLKAIESLLQRAKTNLRDILSMDFENRRKTKK